MDIKKVTKVIYHKACNDGLTSAAIAYNYVPEAEYIPGQYGDTLPDFTGETILIVDFSISKKSLLKLMINNTIYFVDHHLPSYELKDCFSAPHFYHVDKAYCGALNLWRLINGTSSDVPKIVQYVNDRDLWENKLPLHKEVFHGLSMESKTVPHWNSLLTLNTDEIRHEIITVGNTLKKKITNQIQYLSTRSYIKEFIIDDNHYKVIYVNSPFHQSDLGNYLVTNNDVDFAAVFSFNGEDTVFSLRGKDKVDLSKIASLYGGGGHFNASGCAKSGIHISL